MKRPNAGQTLVILWVCLSLLAGAFYVVGGNLQERWRAHPPTSVEETDCQIESMMGGDNPLEVSQISRACLQAANDAYVAPRRTRLLLFSVGLLLLCLTALAGATWQWSSTRARGTPS